MTLPPCRSWSPVGQPLEVAYQANEGRRINAMAGHFTHGPLRGRFVYQTWAVLPKANNKEAQGPAALAAQGLSAEEVGPINAERVLAFFWLLAGRPADAAEDWQRELPLVIALDNYGVHHSRPINDAVPVLEAANVFLFFLPAYSPHLSRMEPDWNDIKQHHLPVRSFQQAGAAKEAVDQALSRKADLLARAASQTTQVSQLAT